MDADSPAGFLLILLALTAGSLAWVKLMSRRRQRALGTLAREFQAHFCSGDRFRLTDRVAAQFPIAGAADLRLSDLIYGSRQDHRWFVLTAEYTLGVIRPKRPFRRAVSIRESKLEPSLPLEIAVADPADDMPDQYRALLASAARG